MMRAIFSFLAIIALTSSRAHASGDDGIALASILKQYKAQISADKPNFPALEAKAVIVVQKMTAKSKVLNTEQLDAYFEVLRYAVPNDPGAIFAEDTIDVIRANRKAIDAKIKKLPSQEASHLDDALDAYTANAESGPD